MASQLCSKVIFTKVIHTNLEIYSAVVILALNLSSLVGISHSCSGGPGVVLIIGTGGVVLSAESDRFPIRGPRTQGNYLITKT